MNNEEVYRWYLKEIDSMVNAGVKRLSLWETKFIENVRPRIERGIFLTREQEIELRKLFERCTELKRIKW